MGNGKQHSKLKRPYQTLFIVEYEKAVISAAICRSIYQVYVDDNMDDSAYCHWFRRFQDAKNSSNSIVKRKLVEIFLERRTTVINTLLKTDACKWLHY